MLVALVAPDAASRSSFGQAVEGPVAHMVVRDWGALVVVGLFGALLICDALRDQIRTVAMLVAGTSRVVFIARVLSLGWPFLQWQDPIE
jgi:hypothetical protein